MLRASLIAVTASVVLVTGCASTPRSFAPVLAAAPADTGAYEQVLASCQEIAAQSGGRRSGRLASAVPIIGLAAAWGLSRINRGNKERRINQAAQDCLATEGYAVTSWERVRDRPPVDEPVVESELVASQDADIVEGGPEGELTLLTTQ